MRLTKAWQTSQAALAQLRGNLGVFQLGDLEGNVLYVGVADGRSSHGLRGAVAAALQHYPDSEQVRFEVTTAYHTRYRELLMLHVADHGELPEFNRLAPASIPNTLGRLSPG